MSRPIPYSADELNFIQAHSTLPRREAHAKFCAKFDRSDVSLVHFNSLCKRKGWLTGRTGRFQKGQTPPNKGRKGYAPPGCEKGWFKKGHRPHNTKFAGHERVCAKDGYVYLSVKETNPHTGFKRRYVLKHKWLWEQKNGPVPEGRCLKSIDGDRTNCDPNNWQLIERAMLPRLSGRCGRAYDQASAEVKPTILLTAQLEHVIAKKRGRRCQGKS